MSTRDGDTKTSRNVDALLHESVLSVDDDELFGAIRDAGLEPATLVRDGRSLIEAALASSPASGARHKGLVGLLELLRRNHRLTLPELADAARVSLTELQRVYEDAAYKPGPRTVFQLENYFRLKDGTLAVLAGLVTVESERSLDTELVRFAAMSAGTGKLTRSEQKMLNEFVSLLATYVEKQDAQRPPG